MNQSVMVFSNSTARSAALTSPIEGMVTYLEDTSSYESYNGTSWVGFGGGSGVLQVVSVTKSDTFETSSTTFGDVTGLTASITPTSATSKILVNVSIMFGLSGDITMQAQLLRNSTLIGIGDADQSRTRVTLQQTVGGGDTFTQPTYSVNHLDNPATTSELTYKIQARVVSGTGYVNRSGNDGNNDNRGRGISSITLMEVAG
jgi:hypothetical protein